MKWISLLVIVLALMSCTTYSEEELNSFDAKIQHYIDSTGLQMERTEDGLYYSILEEGEGEEFIGYKDHVTFYYKGSFLSGNSFQVISKNDPLNFTVSQLIIGWQDALMMLKKGGSIHIIIPPQLGYADRSSDVIPANTVLEYELTVLDVQ